MRSILQKQFRCHPSKPPRTFYKKKETKTGLYFSTRFAFSNRSLSVYSKVTIKKEWHVEAQSFLLKKGISEDFIYGRELGIESR